MLAKLKSFLTYRNLILANLIVLAFKIIYLVFVQKEFGGLEDFTIAKNIVQYHQYSEFIDQGGTAFKLPVYPFCMAIFIWLFGDNALFGLAIFQAILSFSIPILIYKTVRLFGLGKTGITAGFLFLLSPAYFLYPGNMEATNVFVPILLFWFYLYFRIWFSLENKNLDFIIFGVVTAFLFLTQVVIVPLSGLMILALLIFKKANFKNFSYLVLTIVLLYSPWIIRNYYVFDKFVPSKTPTWQNIYYGFTENGQLLDDLKLISKERDHELYQTRDENSELVMEDIYKNEVKKVTHFEPHFFIKKAMSNFFCLWFVPPKYFDDNSLSVLLGRKMYVLVINLLTLISLIFIYRKSKIMFWFSLLFIANFSFPYMIGHANNIRFKLDFEWFQLILIAYLLAELYKYYQQKNVPRFRNV